MSHLAKQFIRKPKFLKLYLKKSNNTLILKGPVGQYSYPMTLFFYYSKEEKKLWLKPRILTSTSFYGLSKVLLSQAWLGSLLGFRQQLNIVGVGYQASYDIATKSLKLKLGFSHTISFFIPPSIEVSCPKPRVINLRGMNLEKLQNMAALIRLLKLPNSYKEKGIYYSRESLKLKQGKKT